MFKPLLAFTILFYIVVNSGYSQTKFRIVLPDYENYTFIPETKNCKELIKHQFPNGQILDIKLFDCKGEMHVRLLSKDSTLIEEGSYINSLDLLKSYYTLIDVSTRKKTTQVSKHYQPLRDGKWLFYDEKGRIKYSKLYEKGILKENIFEK